VQLGPQVDLLVPLVPLEKLQELSVELLLELLRVSGHRLPAEPKALLAPSLQHQAQ